MPDRRRVKRNPLDDATYVDYKDADLLRRWRGTLVRRTILGPEWLIQGCRAS
ncbi:hypothetical protein [Actinoallomurus acaciae]|uniref:Uncharacterized protein n=1 Tax=Actinoallomurus acaciae TaxID=502577 RepID=A0ABV5YMA6_9ACTN